MLTAVVIGALGRSVGQDYAFRDAFGRCGLAARPIIWLKDVFLIPAPTEATSIYGWRQVLTCRSIDAFLLLLFASMHHLLLLGQLWWDGNLFPTHLLTVGVF